MKKNITLALNKISVGQIKSLVFGIVLFTVSFGYSQTTFLNEPFPPSDPFSISLPSGWTAVVGTDDKIQVSNTSLAGGAANEATIIGNFNTAAPNNTNILYYGPINTSGYNSLSLSWKNVLKHFSSFYNYSVSVQTSSDGLNWNSTSWGTADVNNNMNASTQSITINTTDVGSSTFYIGFKMSGKTYGCYYWNIDDVLLQGTPCGGPSGGSVAGNSPVCSGSTGQTYTYSGGTPAATSWNWNVPTGATITAGAGTNSITVTLGTTNGNVTCTPKASGCAGTAVSKEVVITPTLSAVSITPITAQNMCLSSSGSLLTVAETGGNTIISRQWGKRSVPGGPITSISGATESSYTPSGTGLTAGTWYIVCTSTPACGSAMISNEVTITVNSLPTISGTTTPISYCQNASATALSVNGEAGSGTISRYEWYSNTSATNSGGTLLETHDVASTTDTYIPITTATGTLYYYTVISNSNNCSTTSAISGAITVNSEPPLLIAKAGTNATASNFKANWNISSFATGYYLDVSTINDFSSFVTGFDNLSVGNVTTYSVTGLSANTIYYYRVRAYNACATSSNSNTIMYATTPISYCIPSGSNSSYYISDFSTTGGITNITNNGTGFSAGGFGDYTAQVVTLVQSSSVNVSIKGAGSSTYGFAIWVDWDRSGVFETNERVFVTSSYGNSTTGSFTVPVNAIVGNTRMRVETNYSSSAPSNPCATSVSAEFEDYTLTVAPLTACSDTPNAGIAGTTPQSICPGNKASMSISGYSINLGITFQWEQSSDGLTGWTNVSEGTGATTTSYTTSSLSTSQYYRCAVTCTNSAVTSYTNNVEINVLGSISSYPYLESFSSTFPSCWFASESTTGATTHWVSKTADASHGADSPKSGTHFMSLNVYSASLTYNTYNLTTSNYDLGTTPKQVNYYYYLGTAGYKLSPIPLTLQISTNNGSTWIDLFAHTSDNSSFASTSSDGWNLNTVDLTSYANQTVKFRFVSNSNYGSGYCNQGLDEFSIENIPSCISPNSLITSEVGSTTATISWGASSSAPASGYEYYVSTSATPPTTETIPTGTTAASVTSADLTSLSAFTLTYFWVRSNCNSTDKSTWAGPKTFTTKCLDISSFPWTEDFETTTLPDCWSESREPISSSGWSSTATGYQAKGVRFDSYNNAMDNVSLLKTPVLDITSLATAQAEFWWKNPTGGNFKIVLSTDGGVTFPNILVDNLIEQTSWTLQTINLTSFIATGDNIVIGFEGTSNYENGDAYIYLDKLIVDVVPTCIAPSAVISSEITTTSAVISWTAPSLPPSNGYEYEARTSGEAGSGVSGLITSGATAAGVVSAIVIGLTDNTTYSIYVRTGCGDSDYSAWTIEHIVTTPCAAISSFPWIEDFETTTTFPDCWSESREPISSSGWSSNATGYQLKGVRFNSFSNAEDNVSLLKTPVLDITSLATAQAEFWWKNPTGGNFKIVLSTDGGVSFPNTLVDNLTAQTDWTLQTINLTSYISTGNNLIIGFEGTSNYGSLDAYIYIDKLIVDVIPSCIKPTLVKSSGVTPTSATISWTAPSPAPGNGYEYEVRASGEAGSGASGLITSGATAAGVVSANITGLTDNTSYFVYLKGSCGGSDFSVWTNVYTFTTTCYPTNIPYTQDFESILAPAIPLCNSIENAGTGNNWVTANNPGYGFSSNTLKYSYNSSNTANAWYYTQGLNLTSETTYKLTFRYGCSSSSNSEKIKIAYGISPSSTSMTTLLYDNNNITNTTPNTQSVFFTPSSSGTFYIGFNAYSDANKYYLYIDDISTTISCTQPTTQASNATYTNNNTGNSLTANWTRGNGTGGALVVARLTTTLATEPLEGIVYEANIAFGLGSTTGAGNYVVYNGTGTNVDVTALIDGANYTFDIYEYNSISNCYKTPASSSVVSVNCPNVTLTYNQGFNTASMPSCWLQQFVSGSLYFTFPEIGTGSPSPNPQEGTNLVMYNSYSNSTATRLVSPAITTTGTSSVDAEFQWYFSTSGGGTSYLTEGVQVQYSVDGTTWVNAGSLIKRFGATAGWSLQTVTLPVEAADKPSVYVGFLFTGNGGYDSYMDAIVIKPSPSCLAPKALTASAVTSTTATLLWSASASNPINGYEFEVRTSGVAESGPTGLVTTGLTTAGEVTKVVTGLSANTTYYAYVRAHCVDSDFSSWNGPYQFTTLCGVYIPVYNENFSSFIPTCWSQAEGLLTTPSTITGTASYWGEDGFANNGSVGSAKINIYGSSRNEWLISPSIDLGNVHNYQLEFNLALTSYSSTNAAQTNGSDDRFAIVISTDDGLTWTEAQTLRLWDNAGSTHIYNNISKIGEMVIIDLSAYAGIVKFGFYGESTISNADNDLFVDNFVVRLIPTCPQPTELSVTNILHNQAKLGWNTNGSATTWDIEYGSLGFLQGTGTALNAINSNPYVLTGLSPSTTYSFYVRSRCSASDLSYWTGPYTFITPCTPVSTLPWSENFDALTIPALPSCWYKENGDWVTTNNANTSYDADGFSGTQFLRESYSANNEYIWTLGFNLFAGAEYNFSFWWAGDTYAGWTGDVFCNTNQNSTGAKKLGPSFVTSATTTTKNYAQVMRTFTPLVDGTYYFAIRVNATSSPWHLSLDDFNLQSSTNCNQPSALTISNVADVSAVVSWATPSPTPAGGYNYYCSTSSNPPTETTVPTGSVAGGITTGSITGLTAVKTYYVWVRSECGPSTHSTWAGPVMFVTPDLSCISALNFAGSSVLPVLDGGIYYFNVCKNSTLTLKANATPATSGHTLTYKWKINAYNELGPVNYTNNPLTYLINKASGYDGILEVTDATTPCQTNYPFRIRSSGNPVINTIYASLDGCAGNATNILVGGTGSQIDVTPHSSTFTATMGSGATTFIPDGPYCTSKCYESTVNFTDFPIGSKITSAADLLYLKLNLEHSFIGDIQISLVCPNGSSARILQDFFKTAKGGLDNDTYTWPYMSSGNYTSIGFGNPRTTDISNPASPCNSLAPVNAPGSGWDYCWSNNSNYSYAAGSAYVYEKANISHYSVSPNYRVNASDMENKSNFYHPFQNFSALVGCPLNGTWKIKVCDSWAQDNGWIFNWELALNPSLMPSPWSYVANIHSVDFLLGTNASASLSTNSPLSYDISPSPSLMSGSYSGTYTVRDEYGCSSNGNINYTVTGIPPISGIASGDLLWTGQTNTDFDVAVGNWMRKTNTGYEISPVIPDANTNVYVIDYCANNNPVVVNSNVSCKNLTIGVGKTLSMGTQVINVTGDWKNNGTFEAGTGLVIFKGTTNQSISPGSSAFNNIIVNKASGLLFLNSDVTVNNELKMVAGIVNTNGNTLMLGTSMVNKGDLLYTNGHIRGKLKRWFSASTNLPAKGFFPMGNGTLYRPTEIEYKTAPSTGGSLTVMFNETPMSWQNSNLMAPIPITGTCPKFLVSTFSQQGYWQVDPADGLTGGTYDITLYANGLAGVTDLCNLTAIKRVGAGNWSISGTHVKPTGTITNPILKRKGASGWSNWGIGGSNSNMLPVELLNYTAECITNKVNLYWSTASEVNNSYFSIERSDDAQNWSVIGTLSGSGNSTTNKNYQFEDVAPLSNNSYYRLSQTDYDGQQEIFAPISINCKQTIEPQVIYYPNPLISEVTISFQNIVFEKANLTIYDVLGNKVLEKEISSPLSDNILKLDLSFLTVGVYTVKFSTEEFVDFSKIIKK